jgi:hypothetical protein
METGAMHNCLEPLQKYKNGSVYKADCGYILSATSANQSFFGPKFYINRGVSCGAHCLFGGSRAAPQQQASAVSGLSMGKYAQVASSPPCNLLSSRYKTVFVAFPYFVQKELMPH